MKNIKLFGVIGASSALSAAAIAIAVAQGPAASSLAGEMQTGVTVTNSAAPSAAKIPVAVPEIKGPAPLPLEQQGVPG